ncbi:hypothetical protein Ae201684P_017875 [Aphanomyces euteiches]|uniref:Uncharacterized protein n=1 Tax=Aphanomyces euteiches TaxID=100861 RepID=A0A6G0XNL1_9STRA|nr:hypothetical protein Ae201684_003002 [Aphanomyces euteiches]KAH9098664.1 hypothetical protein Ae201684P_017875 [Aphanomyces euteiches]
MAGQACNPDGSSQPQIRRARLLLPRSSRLKTSILTPSTLVPATAIHIPAETSTMARQSPVLTKDFKMYAEQITHDKRVQFRVVTNLFNSTSWPPSIVCSLWNQSIGGPTATSLQSSAVEVCFASTSL